MLIKKNLELKKIIKNNIKSIFLFKLLFSDNSKFTYILILYSINCLNGIIDLCIK